MRHIILDGKKRDFLFLSDHIYIYKYLYVYNYILYSIYYSMIFWIVYTDDGRTGGLDGPAGHGFQSRKLKGRK